MVVVAFFSVPSFVQATWVQEGADIDGHVFICWLSLFPNYARRAAYISGTNSSSFSWLLSLLKVPITFSVANLPAHHFVASFSPYIAPLAAYSPALFSPRRYLTKAPMALRTSAPVAVVATRKAWAPKKAAAFASDDRDEEVEGDVFNDP